MRHISNVAKVNESDKKNIKPIASCIKIGISFIVTFSAVV